MGSLPLGPLEHTVYAPKKLTPTNSLSYGRQLIIFNYTIVFFMLANFSANLKKFQRVID